MRNTHKSIITTFLLLALKLSLYAQGNTSAPSISWQKSIGGSGTDIANCVQLTSDGGFIIAGASNSNDADITGNHGQNDFCLIKLNESGAILWQHSYGGTAVDEAKSVVQTSDGGYAVAGNSGSHNGNVTGNHGVSDYWLVKTDDQGNIQWQKSYGGSQSDIAYSIISTSDNGFAIAGTTYSNDGDVSGYHNNCDTWIIKLDQNGSLQWQKVVGGSKKDIANDIKQTNDGGYVVTGYSLSNDGDIPTNKGQEDFLFFKLDANGNLEWLKTMGGSGGDIGRSGVQTIDGGFSFCGFTHSSNLDIVNPLGGHDIWIIKTDAQGTSQWACCLGGSDTDEGIDIKQQSDGTIIACGNTGSNNMNVTGLHGLYDIWITALDTSGNVLWGKTFGGSNYEYPGSLQIISSGHYAVAGRTNSNDGDVNGNHGGYDIWMIDLNTTCVNTYYADADSDGYGDPNFSFISCSQPSGYINNNIDCNDSDSAIHPGALEELNSIDDDCNGIIDDEETIEDNDHDGYSIDEGDCNDSASTIHPGANETCNGIDDNCDGQIDEGVVSAAITPTGSVTLCSGSTMSLYANSGSGFTYQWKKNGSTISGATSSIYNVKFSGTYTVVVSSGYCSATSAQTTVSQASLPNATVSPSGTIVLCPGVPLVMNANTGTGLSYQWQQGSMNISGASLNSYTASVAASYKVTVTNNNGCSKTSASTVLSNYALPVVKISSTGSLNICSTGSVFLGAKFVSSYTYQWYKDNVPISGATGSSYTAAQAGTYYYTAATSNGCSATSGNKVVTSCRLENESASSTSLSVYPNPTTGKFNLELHLDEELNSVVKIEILNNMGEVVMTDESNVNEGALLESFAMKPELPPALYFLKIIAGNRVFFQRIIYQH